MKTTKSTNRRNFLVAAGLGTAGAAAAVVASVRADPTKAASTAADAKPTGYHVTEHIQKYYKTTEV